MFEKEIIAISDSSVNKIKKLGAYFTIEQLNSTDLHPAIKKYIDSELNYLIFLDRKELVQKSAFDYSKPEIVKYFSLISKEIKNDKKVSFEDAKNLIIQAVSFTANFLVRPKWSLTKFIYNEDQLKTIDEIKLSLNYLYYYEYLQNVLKTYIEKKRSLNLSLIDFEVALNKIDKELFKTHTQKLVDNALYSIADFFSLGGIDANKLPTNCVELFLKEKDLIDQLFRLRRSLPVNARQYYTINEIRHIIHTPTSLDKSEQLPSKTDKEEERIFETPKEEKIDKPKPEIKIEKKEENVQAEMFEFETEIVKEDSDKNIDTIPDVKDETTQQQDVISVGQEQITEEQDEIPEVQDEAPEKQEEIPEVQNNIQEEPVDISEETGGGIESGEEIDAVKEELSDEPSLVSEEDLLNEFSSDEELLNAFDSQLKALEEESDVLSSEDENSANENELPEVEQETQSEEPDDETENIEEPKIILEQADTNEDADKNSEPEASVNEKAELIDEEEPVVEDSQKEIRKETKSIQREVPVRTNDLFSFMSNKEIEKIVQNVFNEDREDFATTMEKVTECVTYDEATEILKAVFFSYRVNPYIRDAVTLTNAVSNYFNQAT